MHWRQQSNIDETKGRLCLDSRQNSLSVKVSRAHSKCYYTQLVDYPGLSVFWRPSCVLGYSDCHPALVFRCSNKWPTDGAGCTALALHKIETSLNFFDWKFFLNMNASHSFHATGFFLTNKAIFYQMCLTMSFLLANWKQKSPLQWQVSV